MTGLHRRGRAVFHGDSSGQELVRVDLGNNDVQHSRFHPGITGGRGTLYKGLARAGASRDCG
jgi:hypothetical protein